MPVENKCSIDNMLQAVLSVANQEQSMYYSPKIYESQYNAVTSLLLSKLCEIYPTSQQYHDMIQNFIVFKKIMVSDGVIQLPDEYRNMLGNPSVVINTDDGSEVDLPQVTTESQFKNLILKSKSKSRPLVIVPRSEWDERTTSSYDYPTHTDPICQFIGDKKLQVAPYDIGAVYVLYAKSERKVVYNYIAQPDDTFLFNPVGSVDTEWSSSAFSPIFNALIALYSAYSRDPDLKDWSLILKNGIL